MLMFVPSQAQASTIALQMIPGAGKHVPTAEHPPDSGKPQRRPPPQSALLVQAPPSPPASPAPALPLDPEPLPDPELPLDPEEPELPRDPELSLAASPGPELLEDPDPPPDPELLADPELPPELPSAEASSELTVLPLLEQPAAESMVHTATSGTTARWIDFMAGSSAGIRKTATPWPSRRTGEARGPAPGQRRTLQVRANEVFTRPMFSKPPSDVPTLSGRVRLLIELSRGRQACEREAEGGRPCR
jgi:hypothetical protein